MVRVPGLKAAAIAVVGVFAIAVCVGGASARTSASSTVVFANTSSVQKLDPDVVTNFLDFQALRLIYDTLVNYNDKLQIVPDLATSWKYSNGGKTLTFQLRKGVKFTDGTTFTSANVVASLNRVKDPKTADAASSFISSVTKIVPDGTYAVKLEMSHADTSVLNGLTSLNLAMLSTKAIAAGTLSKTPVGTGPYQFVSWVPNNTFTVKANPGWFGGKVTVPNVEIKTIPNEQSIASALQAGTVQIGLMTQPQITEHLPSSITVQKVLDLSYRALMLQDKTGPLANLYNRLAMACALNRQAVLTSAVLGQGKVVGPVPLGPYASKPVSVVCPTQNISKAKSYLQKAGNPSGFTFTAMISNDLDATSNSQAIAVQSQLKQAGITMNIQNLASNAYIQDWLKGKFQAAFAENGADPNPYTMYGRYFAPGANLGVPAGYSSSMLQRILTKSDAATTAIGAKLQFTALSTYLTANAVWLWLFDGFVYGAVTNNVHGFVLPPTRDLNSIAKATVS
jgi:peptide/nickel transport system substrate-binding protein